MYQRKASLIKISLTITILISLSTAWLLLSTASDPKNEVLLGFSLVRLIMLASVLAFALGLMLILLWLSKSMTNTQRAIELVDGLLSTSKHRTYALRACGAGLAFTIFFFLTPADRIGSEVYQRLAPLVVLTTAVTSQVLIGQFLWLQKKINWSAWGQIKEPLSISTIVLGFFLVLWLAIAWSGIGIEREKSGWLSPGTPLLAQQVLFSWSIGLVFILFSGRIRQYRRLDVVIGSLLWLAAGIAWSTQPMLRDSYFTAAPTPPNFEYYPYSDAEHYDLFAQNVLIGTSQQVGLTNRPLYSLFLALLHVLAGQKYQNAIMLQLLVLALIPVAAYLLASKLAGRPAGLVTAVLLILRERNSIALTNIIEVSHVKLFMSDVPTMLMLLLFISVFVVWLKDDKNELVRGVIAGACLGLAILIRSQVVLLVPLALVGIVFADRFQWRAFFQRAVIFLLSLIVVVAPWVFRNYQVSGRVVVEYQQANTTFIASSYSLSQNDYARLPSETDQQYDSRMRVQILNFIAANPVKVLRFYASYFLHNGIASVAYLPMIFRFNNLLEYEKMLGFWDAPYLAGMPATTWPALLLALCLIAMGIGYSSHRHGWIGMMPLLFHLGYSFSVALVKQSGWRFILPVDWIPAMYYCIGLVELTLILLTLGGN